MNQEQPLKIDFEGRILFDEVITAKQEDDRRFIMLEIPTDITLDEVQEIRFSIKKSENKVTRRKVDLQCLNTTTRILSINLEEQEISGVGLNQCEISLTCNDKILTSSSFFMYVFEKVSSDVENINYFDTFRDCIIRLNEIKEEYHLEIKQLNTLITSLLSQMEELFKETDNFKNLMNLDTFQESKDFIWNTQVPNHNIFIQPEEPIRKNGLWFKSFLENVSLQFISAEQTDYKKDMFNDLLTENETYLNKSIYNSLDMQKVLNVLGQEYPQLYELLNYCYYWVTCNVISDTSYEFFEQGKKIVRFVQNDFETLGNIPKIKMNEGIIGYGKCGSNVIIKVNLDSTSLPQASEEYLFSNTQSVYAGKYNTITYYQCNKTSSGTYEWVKFTNPNNRFLITQKEIDRNKETYHPLSQQVSYYNLIPSLENNMIKLNLCNEEEDLPYEQYLYNNETTTVSTVRKTLKNFLDFKASNLNDIEVFEENNTDIKVVHFGSLLLAFLYKKDGVIAIKSIRQDENTVEEPVLSGDYIIYTTINYSTSFDIEDFSISGFLRDKINSDLKMLCCIDAGNYGLLTVQYKENLFLVKIYEDGNSELLMKLNSVQDCIDVTRMKKKKCINDNRSYFEDNKIFFFKNNNIIILDLETGTKKRRHFLIDDPEEYTIQLTEDRIYLFKSTNEMYYYNYREDDIFETDAPIVLIDLNGETKVCTQLINSSVKISAVNSNLDTNISNAVFREAGEYFWDTDDIYYGDGVKWKGVK